jgi:6-phosphogluconolactonase (cycloisomerase 2 family)
VTIYRFEAENGAITPNDPASLKTAAGFGPRHLAFDGNARLLYVLGELEARVAVFRFDAARGTGEEIQSISMLPEGYSGAKSGAEIAIEAGGNFLCASNRGHDSIAVFRIDRTADSRRPRESRSKRRLRYASPLPRRVEAGDWASRRGGNIDCATLYADVFAEQSRISLRI